MSQATTTSPNAGLDSQIEALRECGQVFWQRGWSVGTSSNYSAVISRNPVALVVTASGIDKGRLSRGDFVRVGEDGQPVIEGQPKSSAETMLHVMLARREGVGAILHTHSVWATLLSDLFAGEGGFEITGYEMLKGLEGVTTHEHVEYVPIFENTQDIPALADEVEDRLFSGKTDFIHGFLIRQHGLYTWGKTVDEARRHVEIYEFLFECIARRMQMQ